MCGLHHGMALVAGLVLALPVEAGSLKIGSSHEQLELHRGGQRRKYYWLKPEEMLLMQVTGPANVGLRFRRVLTGEGVVPPVDLTVVRDDREQGTVRFRLPAPEDVRIVEREDLKASGEVLVKIEVPAGLHKYRLLVSGRGPGVLVSPFLGLHEKEQVVVATPGRGRPAVDEVKASPPKPAKRKPSRAKAAGVLAPPPPEILPPVVSPSEGERPGAVLPPTTLLRQDTRLGAGTRISGSATAMLLVGSLSLLVSAATIHQQARDEPVQIPAGRLHQRAERTYEACSILGGLTAAAVLVTLVFYLTEQPGEIFPGGSKGAPGLVVRF